MPWLDEVLARLSSRPCCGYHAHDPAAVEPTALAAMALYAHGRPEAAAVGLGWLVGLQAADGSLGISAAMARPCWPTGWALLAWRAAAGPDRSPNASPYAPRIQKAVAWILAFQGRPLLPSANVQHDTTLVAWPWVEGTHSWVEPTAINLLALKACGFDEHVRSRDAVCLLCDRAVQSGGWNYGNPEVFGTPLRPHVQATGLALAALAGERSAAGEIRSAVAYLRRTLSADTTTASLCYALVGLAAHGCELPHATAWLERAARRTLERGAAPYLLALLALAALGRNCPWFAPPLQPVSGQLVPLTEGLQLAGRNQ